LDFSIPAYFNINQTTKIALVQQRPKTSVCVAIEQPHQGHQGDQRNLHINAGVDSQTEAGAESDRPDLASTVISTLAWTVGPTQERSLIVVERSDWHGHQLSHQHRRGLSDRRRSAI